MQAQHCDGGAIRKPKRDLQNVSGRTTVVLIRIREFYLVSFCFTSCFEFRKQCYVDPTAGTAFKVDDRSILLTVPQLCFQHLKNIQVLHFLKHENVGSPATRKIVDYTC